MDRALQETVIAGVTHLAPLHRLIMRDDGFRRGDVHTGFVQRFLEVNGDRLRSNPEGSVR